MHDTVAAAGVAMHATKVKAAHARGDKGCLASVVGVGTVTNKNE